MSRNRIGQNHNVCSFSLIEKRFLSPIKRLSDLVNDRFQKELIVEKSPTPSGSRYNKNTDLIVRFGSQASIQRNAIIKDGARLSENQKIQVVELVTMILAPTFENLGKAEHLHRYNEHLLSNELRPNNVIPLQSKRSNNASPVDSSSDLFFDLSDFDRPKDSPLELSTQLFFLESRVSARIFRIAIKIHELSGRWAFLNWKELSKPIGDATSLNKLGNMTLLVNDFKTLTNDEKAIISHYLSQPHNKNHPLLLIGCPLSPEDLIKENLIDQNLFQAFQQTKLKIDCLPLTKVNIEDLVQLLFTEALQ